MSTADMAPQERSNRLLDRGLSQFGAAWLLSFGVTLALSLVAAIAARATVYDLMDRLLMVMLAALATGWFVVTLLALISPSASPFSKALFTAVALGLLLPLLWGPILGVVVAAWLAGATVEYSQVYAQFRIHVAQLLFPVSAGLFHANLLDVGWNVFQVVATIVGFIAAVAQLWPSVAGLVNGTATSSRG